MMASSEAPSGPARNPTQEETRVNVSNRKGRLFGGTAGGAIVAAALGLAAAASAQEAGSVASDDRPNIVLIVADDLGYSDLGAFGGEIETPNLDALVADGLQLTNFYTAPTCSPTRSMLMSGTDNHVAGVGNMVELMMDEQRGQPGYEGFLNDRVVAFPELLQDAGYDTYIAGKWHLGGKPELLPANRGFDKSTILVGGAGSHYDQTGANVEVPVATYRQGTEPFTLPEGFYSTDFYTDTMLDYITSGEGDGHPFFAYLAYTAPHWPLQAPKAVIDKYAGRYEVGYEAIRSARLERMKAMGLLAPDAISAETIAAWPRWEDLTPEQQARESRLMQVYAAMVDDLDANVGRIVDHLKQTGEYDDTVFVFMSDNGAEGNDPDATDPANGKWLAETFDNSTGNIGSASSFVGYGPAWGSVSSTPYRAFKGFTYDGGIRVPAFITAPGRLAPGRRGDLISVMDLAPTILELAGAKAPGTEYRGHAVAPIKGKSLLPALTGTAETVRGPDEALGWELSGRIAIRQGDWKLVWSNKPSGTGDWQLFDVAKDPAEAEDVSAAHPEKLAAMTALWDDYRDANGVVWNAGMADRMYYSNNDQHFALSN